MDGDLPTQEFSRVGLIQHLVISCITVRGGAGISLQGLLDADICLTTVATRKLLSDLVRTEDVIAPADPSRGPGQTTVAAT